MNSLSRFCFVLGMLCAIAGCGRSNPDLVQVRGTITYQGKPLNTGTVTFMPKDMQQKWRRPAISGINVDGTYELKALPSQAGALVGDYLVSVWCCTGSEREGNLKYFVPQKYADPHSSGLTANIAPTTDSGPLELNFAIND